MSASIQPAGVAGVFYPRDPHALAQMVQTALTQAQVFAGDPKALIVPHAGYVYSAPIAATGWRSLMRRRGVIRRLVVLGPAHRQAFDGMAVLPVTHWQTPLGVLRTDQDALQSALAHPGVVALAEPFHQEHCLEVQWPFVQVALGDCAVLPVLIGRSSVAAVASLMERLWGGPETVIVVSSDLSHYLDHATACALDSASARQIERAQTHDLGTGQACGHRGIQALLAQALRHDLRITALDVRTSADTVGQPERVVGYGAFAFEAAQQARLTDAQRGQLLASARATLAAGVAGHAVPTPGTEPATDCALRAQRKVFVTLEKHGALRGCIGSVQTQHALVDDVRINTHKAAFCDPRFKPLAADELDALQISVSVLSHARPMTVRDKHDLIAQLVPQHDGLIVRDGARSALFLPSVWQSLPEPQRFVQHLRRKAGLPAKGWSPTMQAFRFSTECFSTHP